MESGDGGWIRAEADGENPGEEPGLGDDDGWPAPIAGPATGRSAGKRWGHRGIPGFSASVAVTVAVMATAAGVAVGLFMNRSTPTASAVAGATPGVSAAASARSAQLRMALSGRVLAVSRTSITIGGEGPSVTAAVTGATTVTGRAHGIGGVKAGDEISAELTGTPAHLTATAIQDLEVARGGHAGEGLGV